MEKEMTPTPWKINHWGPSDASGITCVGQIDGIWHYLADGVTERIYGIRADVDPMEHNIQGSFEGAHIADIPDFIHQDGGKESKANALAIVAAVNNTWGKNIHPDGVEGLMNALKTLQGMEAWIGDKAMKELFQKTVYPAIEKATIKQ